MQAGLTCEPLLEDLLALSVDVQPLGALADDEEAPAAHEPLELGELLRVGGDAAHVAGRHVVDDGAAQGRWRQKLQTYTTTDLQLLSKSWRGLFCRLASNLHNFWS